MRHGRGTGRHLGGLHPRADVGLERRPGRATLEQRDGRVDLHAFGALGNQQLRHLALVDRLHLDGRLVGLDLGDGVAGVHHLAFRHQPLEELALLHGGRQRGHHDLNGHFLGSLV